MPSHSSMGTAGTLTLTSSPRDNRRGDRGKGEVGVLVILLADREARAAVDHGLHRGADGAGIGDVVPEVRAVVDPRRDEIEAVAEVAEERDAHRVRWAAVDRIGERAVTEDSLSDPERAHQGLLVADRALVRVRRDDRRVADRLECLL